jgi:hypothetical protein
MKPTVYYNAENWQRMSGLTSAFQHAFKGRRLDKGQGTGKFVHVLN